jgi:hypothetical protein
MPLPRKGDFEDLRTSSLGVFTSSLGVRCALVGVGIGKGNEGTSGAEGLSTGT